MEQPITDPGAEPLTHIETFVALVAHEVRTPLAIVKTGLTTLRAIDSGAPAQPGTRENLLAMVDRNVDLAILLMDRMSLARELEHNSVVLAKEPVDLVTLVRQSVGDLRCTVLRKHPIEIEGAEELAVDADPTALREIVFNLLSNAAKYSARETPINIALDHFNGSARMVVRNHGGGVTPGDAEHIFEKFFQADTGYAGVGLGLYVSRGLARAHGGDVTVRPARREGSEFVLELPAA